jgi:hypothetical protein
MKRKFNLDESDCAHLSDGLTTQRQFHGPQAQPLAYISFEDLSKHFRDPLITAARAFGVCTTVFKKKCREMGIRRWPFRKVLCLPVLVVEDVSTASIRLSRAWIIWQYGCRFRVYPKLLKSQPETHPLKRLHRCMNIFKSCTARSITKVRNV